MKCFKGIHGYLVKITGVVVLGCSGIQVTDQRLELLKVVFAPEFVSDEDVIEGFWNRYPAEKMGQIKKGANFFALISVFALPRRRQSLMLKMLVSVKNESVPFFSIFLVCFP
ncbi:hypothetical protein [Pseudomonas sp. RtIB026]|uniref:hypothetical protein n=1 Tax=Pseudomonas sp. RtIB026 TaxID=2749999 RepID=UPI0019419230|nr:hypothetical protein [Pseudomonas sp. RtIB026]